LDIKLSDSGMWTFFFNTRQRPRGWVNDTFGLPTINRLENKTASTVDAIELENKSWLLRNHLA
jgi:hypothetical protein